jgi:hypothetical protein
MPCQGHRLNGNSGVQMTEYSPQIATAVARQMSDIDIDPLLPLIIVDADEVLFQFMASFLEFIEGRNYRFDWSSFALTGNIRDADTDEVIEGSVVRELLPQFFAEHAETMEPVADASDVLRRLSARSQIVVLSNVPLEARENRLKCLKRHDLDYPLIANKGAKGPVVGALLNNLDVPSVFIDDIPHNHTSVAEHAGHVLRLHFIAHPGLADLIEQAEQANHRPETWLDIEQLIQTHFDDAGY